MKLRFLYIFILLQILYCKEKTSEIHIEKDEIQTGNVSGKVKDFTIVGDLVISDGSIFINESEDQTFEKDLKDLPIQDFIELFGENNGYSKKVFLVEVAGGFISKQHPYQSDSTMNFELVKDNGGTYSYYLEYPYTEDEYYHSAGIVKYIKCRNFEEPRQECAIYVKANKLSSSFPNQYFNYHYFRFIVKDRFLFYLEGYDLKYEAQKSFIAYKSKGDKFPKANLEYLKRAIKILNADEDEKLKRIYLDSFESEDLEFFLK